MERFRFSKQNSFGVGSKESAEGIKMLEEDIYTYMAWPWMSKSAVISDDFCEWLFKLRYLDGIDIEVGLSAKTGTNMHATVAKFFEFLDIKELAKIPINYEEPLEDSRIYNFFLKTAMEIIPPDSREYMTYKIILSNFALMEADHWISLNEEFNGNITKVLKYFTPTMLEKFIRVDDVMLYGTIDRKNLYHGKKQDYLEIYDYKTGHVPKVVKMGMKDIGDEFSWILPTNKMFELHFYIMLDICNRGYKIHPDLVDYITNPNNFYEGSKLPRVKSHFIDKDGKPYNFTKHYHVGIIYLGDSLGPFVPKKRANKRSMNAVFRRINKLKTKVYTNYAFQKDVNYWKCKNCTIIEQCLNEIEMDGIGIKPKEDI